MGPQGDSLPNQASKTPDADKLSGPRVPGRDSESLRGVCFFDLWDCPTEELSLSGGQWGVGWNSLPHPLPSGLSGSHLHNTPGPWFHGPRAPCHRCTCQEQWPLKAMNLSPRPTTASRWSWANHFVSPDLNFLFLKIDSLSPRLTSHETLWVSYGKGGIRLLWKPTDHWTRVWSSTRILLIMVPLPGGLGVVVDNTAKWTWKCLPHWPGGQRRSQNIPDLRQIKLHIPESWWPVTTELMSTPHWASWLEQKGRIGDSVIVNDLLHKFSLKWIYFPS